MTPPTGHETRRGSLGELALLMLRLGLTAFGGPAAHLAMLEDEVVRRRGWLTSSHFVDLLGAANLIPGPTSTEMVIHVGMARAGVPGLWIAGACFITPAALLTLAFAWAYVRFGALPAAHGLLYGVKPAVLAIIAVAVVRLARTAVRNRALGLLGLIAFALYLRGASEILLLLGSGVVGIVLALRTPPRDGEGAKRRGKDWRRPRGIIAASGADVSPSNRAPCATGSSPFRSLAPSPPRPLAVAGIAGLATPASGAAMAAAASAAAPSAWAVGFYFLRIGSVLFGSGYVLLAFLQQGLVAHYGWLTRQQLLDAVAVGQFTPGPLFSTATFVGYVIAGLPGAAAATLGIFLPSFFFVWLTYPLVPKLRASPWASGFLDGVNAGSLALMAAVALELARGSLGSWPAAAIALAALVFLLRTRLNTAWVVLGGALIGALLWR